ncbi:MAG: hypothetical protein LUG18_15415 [Candidatus Azobacteroides sp.]|nr:hypothetical protein [Candidatus Azobacteroides sp.]
MDSLYFLLLIYSILLFWLLAFVCISFYKGVNRGNSSHPFFSGTEKYSPALNEIKITSFLVKKKKNLFQSGSIKLIRPVPSFRQLFPGRNISFRPSFIS